MVVLPSLKGTVPKSSLTFGKTKKGKGVLSDETTASVIPFAHYTGKTSAMSINKKHNHAPNAFGGPPKALFFHAYQGGPSVEVSITRNEAVKADHVLLRRLI